MRIINHSGMCIIFAPKQPLHKITIALTVAYLGAKIYVPSKIGCTRNAMNVYNKRWES